MSESIIGEYIPCKRCGDLFEKRGWNQQYCPACKNIHHNERASERWFEKHGKRVRRKRHVWSGYRRFSFFLDKTWQSATCPICKQHMSACQCSATDPSLRRYEAQPAQTWKPWKL